MKNIKKCIKSKLFRAFSYFHICCHFFGCVSISVFTSLVAISVGVTFSAVGLKNCSISAGVKNYYLIMRKERKKQDEIDSVIREILVRYYHSLNF